jgi:hypothetical protein
LFDNSSYKNLSTPEWWCIQSIASQEKAELLVGITQEKMAPSISQTECLIEEKRTSSSMMSEERMDPKTMLAKRERERARAAVHGILYMRKNAPY